MADEFVDVLVVGAGISGIGAGYHLQKFCPDHSFAIVDRAVSSNGEYPECAATHDVERVRPVALLADGRSGRDRGGIEMGDQAGEGDPIQSGQQLDAPQQIALFVGPGSHRSGMVGPRSSQMVRRRAAWRYLLKYTLLISM